MIDIPMTVKWQTIHHSSIYSFSYSPLGALLDPVTMNPQTISTSIASMKSRLDRNNLKSTKD